MLFVKQRAGARVLVLSQRAICPTVGRCALVEFEDLICEVEDADLAVPKESLAPKRWARALVRGYQRATGRTFPAWRREDLPRRQYDLLFIACQGLADLTHFGRLERWTRTARRAALFVAEAWDEDVARRARELPALSQFTHVFVGCHGTVARLARHVPGPCAFVPPAVNMLHFAPGSNAPRRVIDVYSMGRREAAQHAALRAYAELRGWLYLYDTYSAKSVYDAHEHRRMLASAVQRTRFFVVNPAKVNLPQQTGRQEEVGYRFFEGAAGGAVLIGQPPRCPTFTTLFGWADAVVPIKAGQECVGEVLDELHSSPQRVAHIGATNERNSLLRHDWVYRWETILNGVGLEPRPAVQQRKLELARRAARIGDGAELARSAKAAANSAGLDVERSPGVVSAAPYPA